MSAKTVYLKALALTLLGVASAGVAELRAQDSYGNYVTSFGTASGPDTPVSPGAPGSIDGVPTTVMPATGPTAPPTPPSAYILYSRPQCCSPHGANGPIGYELYVRSGPSLPVGGGDLSHLLEMGWDIGGGAKIYFFDAPQESAWFIDLGLNYTWNNGDRGNLKFDLFGDTVTVNALHRTFVTLGAGKEWWLLGAANSGGNNLRWGFDAGGRYGTVRLDLNDPAQLTSNFERRNGRLGATYIAVHSDFEYSLGCCALIGGARVEWDFTWMDLIPPLNSNIQDVNLLLSAGLRY